ncbi:S-adenosylmethionine mitochondrial carrier protein isoform X2 [Dunckerocampus dactyliophorus]|uniref:S-adenosylmethionine mitochondrial carrier protein isoform X2 n=1 Tax=Dunckerocampus dactyliophorus TaxID=161453 RepID=UPI002406E056|nr:S-adenosylmethionine mitochondrial carrier protein isoform X2 [Dunckerocampus dactyliophorus]
MNKHKHILLERLSCESGRWRDGSSSRPLWLEVVQGCVWISPSSPWTLLRLDCRASKGSTGLEASGEFMQGSHLLHSAPFPVVACLIRVPTEVVKQRTQASPSSSTSGMLVATLREEGVRGLYRGFRSTLLREIPFSLVQFPLWEYLKTQWSQRRGHTLHSWQAAVCGAFAGAVAAFVTTPLDVAKTRIMLAKAGSTTASGNIPLVLCDVWKSRGLTGLFAGSIPRMTSISVGGFIFLGAYEKVRRTLLPQRKTSLS